ncbi:DUF3164 family protein [Ferrovibrio sp.]|uniref:DUF3164 family protein n=1 Tax=Ferrovibrio sp. TaxID=1917215 RepID=UPI0035ADC45C
MNDQTQITVPEGYKRDAKGRLIPLSMVSPLDLLRDQTIEKMIGFALDLSAQIARFKLHTQADFDAFRSLAAERYGVTVGGTKGNLSLVSFDGCQMVKLAIADRITFTESLESAKALFDQCVSDWATGARDEIKALVMQAFEPNKEGTLNRESILALRRLNIEDERWQRAVAAINDAIKVEGSKSYYRFYTRPAPDAEWKAIPIDIAAV